MLKKTLDLYAYFFQNWVCTEETLMELNVSKVINSIKKEFDSEPVYN